jgi:hypothetical protein
MTSEPQISRAGVPTVRAIQRATGHEVSISVNALEAFPGQYVVLEGAPALDRRGLPLPSKLPPCVRRTIPKPSATPSQSAAEQSKETKTSKEKTK